MALRIECADGRDRDRAIAAAKAAVRRGDLVVLPTESVYGLATDAFSERGVEALREAKGYGEDVPLPVMVGARSTLAGIASGVSPEAQALIDAFWPGPLTLILNQQPTLAWALPGDAPLSVRMPLRSRSSSSRTIAAISGSSAVSSSKSGPQKGVLFMRLPLGVRRVGGASLRCSDTLRVGSSGVGNQ